MTTKAERHALAFLAGVALLGAATRVYRARNAIVPTGDLDRQIAAVETTAAGRRGRGASPQRGAAPRPGRGAGSRSPRYDTTMAPGEGTSMAGSSRLKPRSQARVDLDTAAASDIERLPGIGPVLATRIVANRTDNGAFGCLTALRAVKGIGPAMLHRLDSSVVFSGVPRTTCR